MSVASSEQYERTEDDVADIAQALVTIRTAHELPFTAENKIRTAATLLLDAANIILTNEE